MKSRSPVRVTLLYFNLVESNMNIQELSIEALKSMVYDNIVAIQSAQNNIKLLEEAIKQKLEEGHPDGNEVLRLPD